MRPRLIVNNKASIKSSNGFLLFTDVYCVILSSQNSLENVLRVNSVSV